ncbi:hypothetical protein E4631_06175 [Hymenobacter sp. UV11]|uniref:RteC domain-containing protein n=1 Tax=Hymenobacter sp. UV11 TaxID=1849735 RepID=UPI0010615FF0|nr:RteC domain-containing protein [Hymenobacter sp. UV11]TDN38259.1 hypothetical protein A8B98_24960 [Hymenobacter sp. UV11]TFZ67564.1 hypothetical protein E4631_06175 [Hymenobacter sp. UV11]
MEQLPGQKLWDEIKEARRDGLTKQGNRYIQLDVFKRRPIEQNIPARIYETDFQNCFFWVLSGVLPNGYFADDEEKLRYESLYGPPLPLFHVIPYLNQLLGEKLETVYGFSALVDDYQYLVDLITQGLPNLQPVPTNLTHAHNWLIKQTERLEAINLATGIAEASRKLAEQQSFSSAQAGEFISSKPYKWNGSLTEIVELSYSLIASGLIVTGNREKFTHLLAAFFGEALKDPANTITKAKGRKSEKTTILDKLKPALDHFLTTSKSDTSK